MSYTCGGACGNASCTFVTDAHKDLKRHANPALRATWNKRKRERVRCVECAQDLARGSVSNHMVRKHGRKRRVRRRVGIDACEYSFLKRLVRRSIQHDREAGRGGEVDDVPGLALEIHARTRALGGVDDNGGNCRTACAMVHQPFSLFSTTLDRIDDSKPHFIDNGLSNICFTIRGMNQWTSLQKGSDMCARLRAEMCREVSAEEVSEALRRERHCTSAWFAGARKVRHNILYESMRKIWYRDASARKCFKSRKRMFAYIYKLYVDAKARCAISGIFLSGHAYNRVQGEVCAVPHPFQPSVDAVDASRGHVRGNLRVVCKFLNPTDRSKCDANKALRSNGDAPQSWTPLLWKEYVMV